MPLPKSEWIWFDGEYIPGSGDTVADYGAMVEKAKLDASRAGFIMPELVRLGGQTAAGAIIGGLAAAPEGGFSIGEGAAAGGLVGFGTGARAIRRMAQEGTKYARDGLPEPSLQSGVPSESESVSATPQPHTPGAVLFGSLSQRSWQS